MEHTIVLNLNTDHSEQEIRSELGSLERICAEYLQCDVSATYDDGLDEHDHPCWAEN